MPEAARCPVVTSDVQALSRRGWELTQAGDGVTGLACHEQAAALPTANAFTHYHKGHTELQLGLAPAARRSFEKSVDSSNGGIPGVTLDKDPATEAHFQLAKLARDDGDLKRAELHYARAIALSPDKPGAHVMLGVTLRDAGRANEALARYSTGLRLQPAIPAAQYNRAQLLLQLDRRAEALAGFEAAVTTDPSFALAYWAIGDELSSVGRHADALRAFKRHVALQPDSAQGYYAMGKVYFTTRQLGRAISAHTRALSLPPMDAAPHAYIHNDLGNALSDASGRSDEVLHHYTRAATLMPHLAEALSNVGTALKERTRHQEAAHYFQRAIVAKPTLCEAYKNLGSSYGEIDGRLPEAVNAFEGALSACSVRALSACSVRALSACGVRALSACGVRALSA